MAARLGLQVCAIAKQQPSERAGRASSRAAAPAARSSRAEAAGISPRRGRAAATPRRSTSQQALRGRGADDAAAARVRAARRQRTPPAAGMQEHPGRELTYSVYRRQKLHELQIEQYKAHWQQQGEQEGLDASHAASSSVSSIQQESPAVLHVEEQRQRQQQAAIRARLSPAARRAMRADRRRQRLEASYAVIAAANGVEPGAVQLAAERRAEQLKQARPSTSGEVAQEDAYYVRPRRTPITSEEELKLVSKYQAWKAVERISEAWAAAHGRVPTPEELAGLPGCPGDVHKLMRLQREATAAHHKLQAAFIALVYKLAARQLASGPASGIYSLEDFVTAGLDGLDKGLLKFDPARGNRVSTIAVWWIRDALAKAQPNNRVVHLPFTAVSNMTKVQRAMRSLVADGVPKESLDVERVVSASGLPALTVKRACANIRLEQFSLEHTTKPNGASLVEELEQLDRDDVKFEPAVDSVLDEALASLPAKEAYVLRRVFGLDTDVAKLAEVAAELDVGATRVAQIRDNALAKLRYLREYRYLQEYVPDDEQYGAPSWATS